MLKIYRSLGTDKQGLPPLASSYRDYLSWVNNSDKKLAKAFWQQRFEGFRGTKRFRVSGIDRESRTIHGPQDTFAISRTLPSSLSENISTFAREQQLTVNSVASGLWALVIAELFQTDDAVFGLTVSGRTAPIEGLADMAGLFANVVPVRIRIQPALQLAKWLKGIRDDQFDVQQFEHIPIADVEGVCQLDPGSTLSRFVTNSTSNCLLSQGNSMLYLNRLL